MEKLEGTAPTGAAWEPTDLSHNSGAHPPVGKTDMPLVQIDARAVQAWTCVEQRETPTVHSEMPVVLTETLAVKTETLVLQAL